MRYFIQHSRMGPDVLVGPFDTVDEAFEFAHAHGMNPAVKAMIEPSEALDESGKLRQEVWDSAASCWRPPM